MKRILLFALLHLSINVSAQTLLDTYRKGRVELIPDINYGTGNDWDHVLKSYRNTYSNYRMPIVILPDGTLIINHPRENHYSKLDANGRYKKDFSIVNKAGKTLGRNQDIRGVLNNKLFTEADDQGKILFCDLAGNYLKTLTFDYIVHNMIPLEKDRLLIAGRAIWKDKIRNLVSIVDYRTNKQNLIWESFIERENIASIVGNEPEFAKAYYQERKKIPNYYHKQSFSLPPIIHAIKDKLVIILPSSGEVYIYNTEGKLQKVWKINWKPEVISIEEQRKVLQQAIDIYKEKPLTNETSKEHAEKARRQILNELTTALNNIKPIQLPLISNVIKDSDNNLLFFEFPKEAGENRFHVWTSPEEEKFDCSSSLECEEYDLSITPAKIVFHKGSIYTIQKTKNTTGIPYRIIKLDLN